ncbi:hypothetical protein EI94DRAFT_1698508 [Lactarius quietus]|nr:hypothetical protein EI94DRAFT_1698508 [Lactarius quietus]
MADVPRLVPYFLCLNAAASLTGSINEIDSDITQCRHLLAILSRSDYRRPFYLYGLTRRRQVRFLLSNQGEDLDKSICHFTESILLPLSWLEHGPIFLEAFFLLAGALLMRSKASNKPDDDAIYAAKYLIHLRDQPNEISGIPHHEIETILVIALEEKLETGNMMQNFREMAFLCGELFNLRASGVDTTLLICLITSIVEPKFRLGVPDQPLDELIECLQAARMHIPNILQARGRLALAISLIRYGMTYVNDDYEEAMSMLDAIKASSFPGDGQDNLKAELVAKAQLHTSLLAESRPRAYEAPEYLEEAIYRTRAFCSSYPVKEHPYSFLDPEVTAGKRFSYFGSIEGLEASRADQKSMDKEGEVDREFYRMKDEMKVLLLWIRNNDDTMKIEKGRTLLASYSPTCLPQEGLFQTFSQILFEAFLLTKKIKYLDESISTAACASSHTFNFPCSYRARTWIKRWNYSPNVSAMHMRACPIISCLHAYGHIMHDLQHTTLAATHHKAHSMPRDHASYQVDLCQPEEAIETLERGRALLWFEMRHFRIPIDQLLEADPDLGRKFTAVSWDLEELTKSIPPSHVLLSTDDGAADGLRAVDLFGRPVLKQHTLRSAALSGPVIIFNHSKWRTDILILPHSMPPSLISTPLHFYDRARALKDKLLDSRGRHELDSKAYDETLPSVLAELSSGNEHVT